MLQRDVFELLSARGQWACREVVEPAQDQGVARPLEVAWRPPQWGQQHTEQGFANTGANAPVLARL